MRIWGGDLGNRGGEKREALEGNGGHFQCLLAAEVNVMFDRVEEGKPAARE